MTNNTFLENIIKYKKQVNKGKASYYSTIKTKLKSVEYSRYELFKKKIFEPGKINLIAEIKKASPSKGMLRESFDIFKIAKIYMENNAAAISVLTEDKFFLGKPEFINKLRDIVNLPILAKDFILDEGQIYEARINGASAVLLIASILSDEQILEFIKIAESLDLDCLTEIHNEEELERVLKCGAEIIGVNNRDLKTFNVDLNISRSLLPKIPTGKIIVVESGIKTKDDVNLLKDIGVNAVLIGETFMKSEDIGSKIKELMEG